MEKNIISGYIKLYRSILDKSWYDKSEYVHLFLHLLLKASHAPYETHFNGSTTILQPGQLVTGRKKLSSETGIEESKVERILNRFKTEHQIEQVSSSTSRLITIINWETYQRPEQPTKQRVNNNRTANEQRVNTIQEDKEDKKDKEYIHSEFEIAWNQYDKKLDKEPAFKLWQKLTDKERQTALEHIPKYVLSTPDTKYRKHFKTYLAQKSFYNSIITGNGSTSTITNRESVERAAP